MNAEHRKPNGNQRSETGNEMLFRFGDHAELFGAYHAASGAIKRDFAVVFCAPFAEEKKCSYRTFVETARTFAATGVSCLRFDYFGTGDSEGEFSEFSPSRAADDITAAACEARKLAGVPRLLLLGLRLGGTMALAAAPATSADAIVLWQPIVSGETFFNMTIKRQLLRKQLIEGAVTTGNECASAHTGEHLSNNEVFDLDGFPLNVAAAKEIRSLDCLAAAKEYQGSIHLLQISHTETMSRENRRFAAVVGENLVFAAVRCPPFWNRIDRADTLPVIEQTLKWLG